MHDGIYRFGDFELNRHRFELLRHGQPVKIERIPMELLTLLVESEGRVVPRAEIIDRLWGKDVFVDTEHGVNTAIRKVRTALHDDADSPSFLQTVPGKGYRFIPAVEVVGAEAAAEPSAQPVARIRPGRWWRFAAVALGVIAVVAGLGFVIANRRATPTSIRSIAVLPLSNLSGDPSQDYFAEGMTDALITDLAQASSLKVISRTSTIQYKKTTKSLPQIARELGVDAIVEGSVVRDRGQVRITAQLIDAPNDKHLWARSYERQVSGILALQDEIAHNIASEIRTALVPGQSTGRSPIDSAAYDEYLLGRFFWNKRTPEGNRAAIEHFNSALMKDPNYARAYAGLADAYLLSPRLLDPFGLSPSESYAKARTAARHALDLDRRLAEPHATLARLSWVSDWDFAEAEKEFRLAISLEPNYATARQWHAQLLMQLGRTSEAEAEARHALELDPLSLVMNNTYGEALVAGRQYDAAVAQYKKTIAMDPKFANAYVDLGQLYRSLGKHELAVHEFGELCEQVNEVCDISKRIQKAFAAGGYKAIDRLLIQDAVREGARGQPIVAWDLATYYVELEDFDQAFVWLTRSVTQHEEDALEIKTSRLLDPLRSDPRFPALLKKVGLPD